MEKVISKKKIRLDQLVVQKGLVESREKAKALIMTGEVMVEGVRADKPGHSFPEDCEITLKSGTIP